MVPVGEGFETTNLKKWVSELSLNEVELILIYDGAKLSEKNSLDQLLEQSPISRKALFESSSRNPGGARNLGLKAVTGQWFVFCDADDLPEIGNLVQAISDSTPHTQIIVGQYKKILDRGNQNELVSKTENLADLQEEVGLWRILFRSSEFSKYSFPDSKMGEDQVFLLFCLFPIRTIQYTDLLFYNYFCSVEGQLTQDKKKFEELANSIRYATENLFADNQLSGATAEFSFGILIRMLLTYLFKSHRFSDALNLNRLVWESFSFMSFHQKSSVSVKILLKTLNRYVRAASKSRQF